MATIAENLQRLTTAKNKIMSALQDKGINVPVETKLDNIPSLISSSTIMPQPVSTDISKSHKLISRFAVLSDIHFNSPENTQDYTANNGYRYCKTCISYLESIKSTLDFVAFNGDYLLESSNSSDAVLGALSTIFDEYRNQLSPVPLYIIPGNHETGAEVSTWNNITKSANWSGVTFLDNSKTCFYKEINGDLFIWFGVLNSSSFNYTQAMYTWLFDLLQANANRSRIFLFTHWYDGSVDEFGWRYYPEQYYNNGWDVTDESHATRGPFGQIKNYKNVIWFSGHSHSEWKGEDVHPNLKIHSNNTAKMVCIPSIFRSGEFAIVEVYDNMVVVQPYTRQNSQAVKLSDRTYYIMSSNSGNSVSTREEWETPDSNYPTYLKLKYEVDDVTSPTAILPDGSQSGQSSLNLSYISDMVVDGIPVTPTLTYQFNTTGEHTVLIQAADNLLHASLCYKVQQLKTVYIPSNITNSSASAFKSCPNLEKARFDMTLSSNIVNNFIDRGNALKVVKFGKNIPGISGANVLANIPAMTDIYIEASEFEMADTNIGGESVSNSYNVHVNSGFDQNSISGKFPSGIIIADL